LVFIILQAEQGRFEDTLGRSVNIKIRFSRHDTENFIVVDDGDDDDDVL